MIKLLDKLMLTHEYDLQIKYQARTQDFFRAGEFSWN